MSDEVKEAKSLLVKEKWPIVCSVWKAMREQLQPVNLEQLLAEDPPDFGSVEVRKDPFDQSESLIAHWYNKGQMVGNIVIHANDQAFAEYDVVQPHPSKTGWFIEATTAWGSASRISAELRLIQSL
ncbi:hypothetical protein P886_3215 [Alteromonadaceae bacterium 2753L.S.0a.02]|nr:hypothetical protein P886_3215 [Alteromonadaceae bacterium 2753L.S.0a.02]